MRDYLMKEEIIGGAYGIEARYPFLDFEVVQEFLWLAPEIKNRNYKNVITSMIQDHGYPARDTIKLGFGGGNLLSVRSPADVVTARGGAEKGAGLAPLGIVKLQEHRLVRK